MWQSCIVGLSEELLCCRVWRSCHSDPSSHQEILINGKAHSIVNNFPNSHFVISEKRGRLLRAMCFASVMLGVIMSCQTAQAEPAKPIEPVDPYACAWFVNQMAMEDYEEQIERRLESPPAETAQDYPYRLCILAELMKRVGDSRAGEYYEKSIALYPMEPAFELFYADYLLFVRGVRNGLVVDASAHYQRAREKMEVLQKQGTWGEKHGNRVRQGIRRGLFYLHRSDGIALSFSGAEPTVFFSTANEVRQDTVSFDYQWVDSRSFTSETLYAQSAIRLNRELTDDELRDIARTKFGVVSSNRLRLRLGNIRAIDLTYRYLRFNDSRTPTFFAPTDFENDVGHEYGIGLQQDFQLPYGLDLFLTGSAKLARRTTSAETTSPLRIGATEKEDIRIYEALVGLSRLIGSGKMLGEFGFLHQNWEPGLNWNRINTYSGRLVYQSRLFGVNRLILNGYFAYQDVFRSRFHPENKDMRSLMLRATYEFPVPKIFFGDRIHKGEFSGGYNDSIRIIGSGNELKQEEIFGFLALRGIEVADGLNAFDVTYRSAYYLSEVEDDSSQKHAEWRNEVVFGYRLVDDAEVQWLPSSNQVIHPALVNVEFPIRHDAMVKGPRDFANYRFGVQLKGDFVSTLTPLPFAFYGTVGYAYERFYNLKENFHIFQMRLGTGF